MGMDFDSGSMDLPMPIAGQTLPSGGFDDLSEMNGLLGLNGDGADEDDDGTDELDDVKKLGRVWVKERGTVDLMGWEGELIDVLFDKLEQQVSGFTFSLLLMIMGWDEGSSKRA